MQMGFDFQDGSQGSNPLGQTGVFAGSWALRGGTAADGFAPDRRPSAADWAGLMARFAAIHALRRSFESSPAVAMPGGSFQAASEAVLASARRQGQVVNRLCSGNGKAVAGMVAMLSPPVPRRATEDNND